MTSCGSCPCASKHEEKEGLKRHWCGMKDKWMLSDAQPCHTHDCTAQASTSSDISFCPVHPKQHLYYDASVKGGVYCPICKIWRHVDESGRVEA